VLLGTAAFSNQFLQWPGIDKRLLLAGRQGSVDQHADSNRWVAVSGNSIQFSGGGAFKNTLSVGQPADSASDVAIAKIHMWHLLLS
jgi:hypothetical protein